MKKVLVTGSTGQLGSELNELSLSIPHLYFIFFNREEFPINDITACRRIFAAHDPQYVINCAAYTAVDKAEEEREIANEVNGKAVGNLAALCTEYGARFLHISTDYVFNAKQRKPLTETDQVEPVNSYGASKLLGERLAFEKNADCIIIRTSWVYSSYGKNFVKTMIRIMRERESIEVVNDQTGSPTYAADLAQMIVKIVSGEWKPGIYHFSNSGNISWFEFADSIREMAGIDCRVNPISTQQYPTPAKRPEYSVLDTGKIKQAYHAEIKPWKESLRTCIDKILSQEKKATSH